MPAANFSVLIPDGESPFAVFVLHCFLGYPEARLYVLSNRRWTPARFSRACRRFLFKPFGDDPAERFDAAAEAVQEHRIDVVLPAEMEWISADDVRRAALAELAAVVPLLDSRSFEIANNKWLLYRLGQARDIPTPPTVLCTFDGDAWRQMCDLEFPVLLKPACAWGGEGIRRFDTPSELGAFLEGCDRPKVENRYIVQALLPGYVIGLNLLCRDGRALAWTVQRELIPNTRQYAAAGAIQFIVHEEALHTGKKLALALGYNGVGNFDLFHDSRTGQVHVLEVNARFWGSLRGSHLAGVSFPYLACLAALGRPFPVPEYRLARYAHPKTAIREGLRALVGKERYGGFGFAETGLRYAAADPVAEIARGWVQQFLPDRYDLT
jgi:D-aspartate ligase